MCLPTSSHLRQSGSEIAELHMQENYSDHSRLAQHALVLRSTDNLKPDSPISAQSSSIAFQPDSSRESVKPKSTCLTPRASAIKCKASLRQWQHKLRCLNWLNQINLLGKVDHFTKWCHSNQVDFRAPPIKPIADFLLYLFHDR